MLSAVVEDLMLLKVVYALAREALRWNLLSLYIIFFLLTEPLPTAPLLTAPLLLARFYSERVPDYEQRIGFVLSYYSHASCS